MSRTVLTGTALQCVMRLPETCSASLVVHAQHDTLCLPRHDEHLYILSGYEGLTAMKSAMY